MTLTVASWPAISSSAAVPTSSSVPSRAPPRRSASRSAATRSLTRSSPGCSRRWAITSRRASTNSADAVSARARRPPSGSGSYIATIAVDQPRSRGRTDSGSPSSSAITSTGSTCATPAMRSAEPVCRTWTASSATSRSASALTAGSSRAVCPRLKAPATSVRRRSWGSPSRSSSELRCSRLNVGNSAAGCASAQIRPRERPRSTSEQAACDTATGMPSIGCSCTGAIARRAEKVGYGSSRKAESAGSNGTGSLRRRWSGKPLSCNWLHERGFPAHGRCDSAVTPTAARARAV